MPKPNPYRQLDGYAPDLTPPRRESWMDDALCAQTDPDLWFADHGQYDRTRAAIRVCRRCPVQAECLRHALENFELGVWGGTTEAERRRMRSLGTAS